MLTKSSLIADHILNLILSRHYVPGDRLPSRNQLARQFRCSRTSVERAIAALAASGNVTSSQGSGTFVAEPRAKTSAIKELRIISNSSPYSNIDPFPFILPEKEFPELKVRWITPDRAGGSLELLSSPCGAAVWVMPSHDMLMLMKHLQAKNIPQVLINREFSGFDCIATDPAASIKEGLQWLVQGEDGPAAFIAVRPNEYKPYQNGRVIAFFESAVELGIDLHKDLIHLHTFADKAEDIEKASVIWDNGKKPPALFVLDQELLPDIFAAAQKRGLIPGKDFKLLTFDAPEIMQNRPGTAMMRQSYELFNKELLNWLRHITGENSAGGNFSARLKTKLVINQ